MQEKLRHKHDDTDILLVSPFREQFIARWFRIEDFNGACVVWQVGMNYSEAFQLALESYIRRVDSNYSEVLDFVILYEALFVKRVLLGICRFNCACRWLGIDKHEE